MVTLNCIVIDDEEAGRKVIEEYVGKTDYLRLTGSFSGPAKAAGFLADAQVDLLFLDIQMPKINGIDFLRSLSSPPITIMITAYSQYAIEGFELDVVDYLLKPISKERFEKACKKAREFWELKHRSSPSMTASDHFFVKCHSQYEKVKFDDVLFVEAANNYVIVHTTDKKLNTYLTLKVIAGYLPAEKFTKVHKSYIVALDKIESMEGGTIRIAGSDLPVSRGARETIRKKVLNTHMFRK
jgi:DNA-binding LytR/AlgR family response regulator